MLYDLAKQVHPTRRYPTVELPFTGNVTLIAVLRSFLPAVSAIMPLFFPSQFIGI